MEVYVVAILAGAGYLISRMRQQKTAVAPPNAPARSGVPSAPVLAADAPSQRSVWESRRFQDVLLDEQARGADLARRALNPASSGVVNRTDRAVAYGAGAGDDARDSVVHSALLGVDIPVERFTHNNMVPFYRGAAKQPLPDDAFTSRLEMFTGAFDDVRPLGARDETQRLFEPTAQGPMSSSGRPVATDFEASRAAFFAGARTRNRANEVPDALRPEVVGRPGVAGGQTGDVYFDMREATLRGTPTVDDLRPTSRPKTTFEGRVLPASAAATATGRPQAPSWQDQLRRGGPLTREMTGVDDLLRTTGAVISEAPRPDDLADIRATNRQTTSAAPGYVGPAGGGGILRGDVRDGAAPLKDTRHALGAVPVGAASAATGGARAADYGRSAILVYGNNRDVTTVRTHQGNFASAVKALVAPIQHALRPTRKDDAVDAPRAFGNLAGGIPKPTVYDPDDVARTTLREAMVNDDSGAALTNLRPAGPPRPTVHFDPDTGVARTCLKESTLAATPAANLVGRPRGVVYDPDDVARATRKQTSLHAAATANLSGGAVPRPTVYDPDDVARATRKQTSLHAAAAANLSGGAVPRPTVYDPEDVARATRKQTSLHAAAAANLSGGAVPRPTVYDPDDAARTTRKQTSLHAAVAANMRAGAFAASPVHDPDDVARTTRKEMTLQAAPVANLRSGESRGTLHHGDAPRTTAREATADVDPTRHMARQAPAAGAAYDPEQWAARPTLRQSLDPKGDLQDGNVGGGLQRSRAGAYATAEPDARATQRQVTAATEGTAYGVAAAAGTHSGAYATTEYDARATQREATSDHEYFGAGLAGGALAQTSYDSAEAMVSRGGDDREAIAAGREPTPQGAKVGAEQAAIGAFEVYRRTGGIASDSRAPSPGRTAPLPASVDMLDGETAMRVGASTSRLDDAEHGGTTLTGDRLFDLVRGVAAQRSTNPTAQPSWGG
jgi:hypothetical protein